ncbi:MAG TPA: alpha/beta hydrolase [Rhabdochlamydiaceae bacterium]|nr:alpha/beta hydrolase [Rhabdochlamydiaceae bacterium]HSX38646.1 alpha/beta hydrolase [Chlamydiales bacterium]
MHYLRTGGDKPSVVLLHGLMTSGTCWTPVARRLEREYDVIMPDARGHGNSGVPDQGYFYENLAADVESLIDALDLANPVLIGHSMGGMTAAVVASRIPKRLRGLILIDPAFLTLQRQHEVHESDVADQHRRILNGSREGFLAETRIRRSHRPHVLTELLVQARFQTSMRAFEILTPPNPDYVQLINALDIPSLLIIGSIGSIISPEMAAELARFNQCLKVVQIAEAGHAIPYDQPERLSAVVQTFLYSLIA